MRHALILLFLVFVSACVQQSEKTTGTMDEDQIISACIHLCELEKMAKDISNGPCLSNDIGSINDEKWVCDVAHSPREGVDNLPENQCSAFREGKAKHFVEVDVNCVMINRY